MPLSTMAYQKTRAFGGSWTSSKRHLNDLNDLNDLDDLNAEVLKITSKYLPGDVKICFPMTPTVGARYPYTKNIGVCFSEMLQRPPTHDTMHP